ncbi:MAG: acyl carrier protein [Pseudomonadota bacterium]
MNGNACTTQVIDILRRAISRHLGLPADQVRTESTLQELGIDSLSFLELTFVLERELAIRFPEHPGPLNTIGDVVAVIERLRTTPDAGAAQ